MLPSSTNAPATRLTRHRSLTDWLVQLALPLAALMLLGFAGWYVWNSRMVADNPPPPIAPAQSPFAATLAAAGIVEAQTENIAVGSALAGVVTVVSVRVDDKVVPGTPLFRLDDRKLKSELAVAKSRVSEAQSELAKLAAEPRPERVPVLTAQVAEARSNVIRETDAVQRAEETFAKGVITEQELIERKEALEGTQARLNRAEADLTLLQAGSWEYDRDIARAAIARAEAEVARIETELDRLTVRALVAGRVLQINVRPGEFVGTPPGQPLIILGNIDQLHVRVDIDEFDIPRFRNTATASAVPRGSLQTRYPLEFVRVEPFVVPKRSLTGETTERVDTRVLQVIYSCDPTGLPSLFVGQQMEVFIDAANPREPAALNK
ncbi:MAG: hypothetical protein RLZZ622_959 [Planctomycetota bacterium]